MLAGEIGTGWRFGEFEFFKENAHIRENLAGRGHVRRGAVPMLLTATETKLLACLLRARGEIIKRDVLINEVWGEAAIEERGLDTYIERVRKKLAPGIIETKQGIGHRIAVPIEPTGLPEEQFALYMTALFLRADDERQRMPDTDWDKLYLPRLDDLRTALAWSFAEPGRRHIAIALAGASGRIWERASRLPEGRQYLDRAVELLDDYTRLGAEAKLLRYAGTLWREADRPKALSLLECAAKLYRQLGATDALGGTLGLIGDTRYYLGQYEPARMALEEAYKILRVTVNTKAIFNVINGLGAIAAADEDIGKAQDYYVSARELARLLEDPLREYIIVLNMADLEFCSGAADRAIQRTREAERGLASSPDTYRLRPWTNLATYCALEAQWPEARAYARSALELCRNEGGYWLRLCLQVWALLAARDGRNTEAARLIGFVDGQFARFGDARQRPEQRLYDAVVTLLRRTLAPESLAIWMREGAVWSEARAVDFVTSELASPVRP